MRVRTLAPLLATAALLVASELVVAPALAAPPGWEGPKRVPGTVGLANPLLAVAPDGTELVAWHATSGMFSNTVKAKLRPAGQKRWITVPSRFSGPFLGIGEIVGTAGGDFWATYSTGTGDYRTYIVRLDSSQRRWKKPVELFTDQADYQHGFPKLDIADDGTMVVTAYAPPKTPPPGDPLSPLAVAVKSPGAQWKSRFLTGDNTFASRQDIDINAAGDIVIGFVQGYDLGEMTVRAATKSHAKGSKWKVRTLSTTADSQFDRASMGADGTAAVIWSAPSSSQSAIRISTANARRANPTWTRRDVITGAAVDFTPWVVVGRTGQVTALWRQTLAGTTAIWSRHLVGTTWRDPVQLTPNGEIGDFRALAQRPDGSALLVYQRFTPSPGFSSLGVESRRLKNGVAGPPVTLIGDKATDGDANSIWLGVDAASRGTVVWTRGTFPDTDFAWMGNKLGKPVAMTSVSSGKKFRRAKVVGKPNVHKRLICRGGYLVEATSVRYQWFADGKRIGGADHARYRVQAADLHDRIKCWVTAKNVVGATTLKSRSRLIR